MPHLSGPTRLVSNIPEELEISEIEREIGFRVCRCNLQPAAYLGTLKPREHACRYQLMCEGVQKPFMYRMRGDALYSH
jgi:hypothetical protein